MPRKYAILSHMHGFTKLFSSILTSTIWREDDKTRIVWITMLALSDWHGIVNASVPGLAAVANVSLEECQHALKNLSSPDEFSRTKEHDGRRIEAIDGGWHILNYVKYRELGKAVDRAEYLKMKQREHRHGQQMSTHVNKPSTVASVSVSLPDPLGKESEGNPLPKPANGECAAMAEALKSEIRRIFKRDIGLFFPYDQEQMIVQIVNRPRWREELTEIERHKRRVGQYFAQSAGKLLHNWDDCLDQARSAPKTARQGPNI